MDTSKALAEQERIVDMLTEKMNSELRKFWLFETLTYDDSAEPNPNLPQDDGYNPSGFAFTPYPSLPSVEGNITQHQPDDWHISNSNDQANKNFTQPEFYYADPNYMNFYQASSNPEPEFQKNDAHESPIENNSTEKEPEKTDKDAPAQESVVPSQVNLENIF